MIKKSDYKYTILEAAAQINESEQGFIMIKVCIPDIKYKYMRLKEYPFRHKKPAVEVIMDTLLDEIFADYKKMPIAEAINHAHEILNVCMKEYLASAVAYRVNPYLDDYIMITEEEFEEEEGENYYE